MFSPWDTNFPKCRRLFTVSSVHQLLPGGTWDQLSHLLFQLSQVWPHSCMPTWTFKNQRHTSHPGKPLCPPTPAHVSLWISSRQHASCLFHCVLWQERGIELPALSGRTSSLLYIIIITRFSGERKCSKSLQYKTIKTAVFYCHDCQCR